MEPWWSKALFIVLGSVLAISASLVTMLAQQHFDKQRRAETLKVAFRGWSAPHSSAQVGSLG